MRERTRYHHGSLPAVLVEVSIELIGRDGLEAFSLAKAARAAGVSAAAPYAHFADKAELLRAIADHGYLTLAESLRAAAAEVDDETESLMRVGIAYIEWVIAHRALSSVMFTSAPQRPSSITGPTALGVLEEVLQRLERAGRLGVPLNVAVQATWGLVHGMAALTVGGMRAVTEGSGPAIRDDVLRAVLHGGLLRPVDPKPEIEEDIR